MKHLIYIAASLLMIPLAFAEETPVFETELHFAFENHCESPPSPDTSPTPFGSQESPPTTTPEPCDPDIPYDEALDAFLQSNIKYNEPQKIDLIIKNPRQEMVTSIRAKIKYDSTKLNIDALETDLSDFPLGAPGENNIDVDQGTITIGRSLTGGSLNLARFYVGTIVITPFSAGAALEYLNFQNSELGDTGIFFTSGVTSENRMTTAPKRLVFGGSSNVSPLPRATPIQGGGIGGDIATPAPTDAAQFPPSENGFARPTGVRIQTDAAGNIRLVWPIAADPPVKGYYLYYGQKSGFYLRRRDVGRTNFAVFPDLTKNEKYYFAITAYNSEDQETDYSDEVSVVVGQPGTESHGFTGDPRNPIESGAQTASPVASPSPTVDAGNVESTVDSGPEHILFFFVMSMGLAAVWYSIRRV